jgi:hypothetical protein
MKIHTLHKERPKDNKSSRKQVHQYIRAGQEDSSSTDRKWREQLNRQEVERAAQQTGSGESSSTQVETVHCCQ